MGRSGRGHLLAVGLPNLSLHRGGTSWRWGARSPSFSSALLLCWAVCQGAQHLLRKVTSRGCLGLGGCMPALCRGILSHPQHQRGGISPSDGAICLLLWPHWPQTEGSAPTQGGHPSVGMVLYSLWVPQSPGIPRTMSMCRSTSLGQFPARRCTYSRQQVWMVRAASWQRLYSVRITHART